RACQCSEVSTQIAASLPERRGVEVQTTVTGQCAKIDVDRPAEAVPACETFRLYTLDIPQRIRDVLDLCAHISVKPQALRLTGGPKVRTKALALSGSGSPLRLPCGLRGRSRVLRPVDLLTNERDDIVRTGDASKSGIEGQIGHSRGSLNLCLE